MRSAGLFASKATSRPLVVCSSRTQEDQEKYVKKFGSLHENDYLCIGY